MTVWKELVEVQGYEIAADGRIRCVLRGQGRRFGQELSPNRSSRGYWQVRIRVGGEVKTVAVHRAVMAAFRGPCPVGQLVRHLDGDQNNNHLDNLAYGTAADNAADKVSHGRSSAGVKNPKAKLTEAGVLEIRAARAQGESAQSIADRIGLSQSTVHRIVNGTYWANVAKEASNRGQERATR